MAKVSKKNRKLTEQEIMDDIKALSEEAQKMSANQLDLLSDVALGDEDIDLGFDLNALKGAADPDKSHRLYYAMRRIMTDNLPKGKNNKKLRKYIYDEKSLYLNRGNERNEKGIKNSDERMAYIDNFLQTAFDAVNAWVKAGANPFDLYMAFYNMNEEKRYHKKEEEKDPNSEQDNPFDNYLKA